MRNEGATIRSWINQGMGVTHSEVVSDVRLGHCATCRNHLVLDALFYYSELCIKS